MSIWAMKVLAADDGPGSRKRVIRGRRIMGFIMAMPNAAPGTPSARWPARAPPASGRPVILA